MPGEKDFGGFAGHHAERRQIPDGVSGDERGERLTNREAPVRRHTQPPCARANQKARASESENGQETPADLADAVEDFVDAGATDGVAEQHQATHRRQNSHDVATPDGHQGVRRPISSDDGLRSA